MLRQELIEDYREVEKLVYNAYECSKLFEYKDVTEDKQLSDLRKSGGFIPQLSLVVQEGWEIVGHIAFEKMDGFIEIKLMSVLPILQKTGVGLQLIMESRDIAKKMGYSKIVVKSNLDCFKQYGFKSEDDLMVIEI